MIRHLRAGVGDVVSLVHAVHGGECYATAMSRLLSGEETPCTDAIAGGRHRSSFGKRVHSATVVAKNTLVSEAFMLDLPALPLPHPPTLNQHWKPRLCSGNILRGSKYERKDQAGCPKNQHMIA